MEALSKVSHRPSEDHTWIRVARVIAERGTCPRLQVGSVVVRDGRPVVSGWNGAPAGQSHCALQLRGRVHPEWLDLELVEQLALARSTRSATRSGTQLIASGIARVVYGIPYRTLDGVHALQGAGVRVDEVLL